ncbi:YcxB family protein [Actinoplanes sp. TRM 88003]|uniref:YcxB family protein n=1 Tax=Paractinoplanes aksuensis TaxID=2939490 RepID=A0ABT1E032_9ACTN|nr:YcxB family protein [Actinoplanes aksuensis]MCO8276498.1 YcxB family protein [Actinoplanes aksuensis]
MFLQIVTRPDPLLTAEALRHGLRRPVLLARLSGWALLGLALLLQLHGDGLNFTLLVAGVALAVIVPMFLVNGGVRRALRDGGPTTVEIGEDGVACSTVESRHAYAWNAFTHVDHLAGQLVLGLGHRRFVQVPTRGMSVLQIHQVLTTAAAHGIPVNRG